MTAKERQIAYLVSLGYEVTLDHPSGYVRLEWKHPMEVAVGQRGAVYRLTYPRGAKLAPELRTPEGWEAE